MSCTIVLGCFRSGSSAVAGVLHHLGIPMGEHFDKPNRRNPKGYFEDKEFKPLHWRMVEGEDCSEEYEKLVRKRERFYPKWGLKDPRLCLTFPKLQKTLRCDSRVIMCVRPKEQMVESLATALGIPSEIKSFAPIVEEYSNSMLKHLQNYTNPVMSMDFDRMFWHPERTVELIAGFVDMPVNQEAADFLR